MFQAALFLGILVRPISATSASSACLPSFWGDLFAPAADPTGLALLGVFRHHLPSVLVQGEEGIEQGGRAGHVVRQENILKHPGCGRSDRWRGRGIKVSEFFKKQKHIQQPGVKCVFWSLFIFWWNSQAFGLWTSPDLGLSNIEKLVVEELRNLFRTTVPSQTGLKKLNNYLSSWALAKAIIHKSKSCEYRGRKSFDVELRSSIARLVGGLPPFL